MPGPYRGQKRILESLDVELQTIVSHYIYAGNWTLVFRKNQGSLTAEPSLQPNI